MRNYSAPTEDTIHGGSSDATLEVEKLYDLKREGVLIGGGYTEVIYDAHGQQIAANESSLTNPKMNEEEKRKEATEVKEEMAVILPNTNGQQEGKDALPHTVTSESTVQLKNGDHGSSTEGIPTGNGRTETLSLRKDTFQ
ncbi:uncharacterized protein TM35_000791010 [Trypanosoma theileri]|uniref:Uncharacterized protein n=1 Tax=Trypanosoma theileri TaxID=67003 RepID=A0A1X0NEZ0_9TRYP|nr:uncharacterized protein TM35_000791010 [Trypanosoma theileri]ORC82975.1 hypothetical protein TM35_000791010 [Trypanosoma theileri]